MIIKSIISVISLSIACIVLTFFLGRLSVQCEDCQPCIDKVKYNEVEVRKAQIKNIEHEIEKTVIDTTRAKRDSLRNILNPR